MPVGAGANMSDFGRFENVVRLRALSSLRL